MMNVLGLSLYGSQAASARYRLIQYQEGLKAHGIELSVLPLLGNKYILRRFSTNKYDFVEVAKDYLNRCRVLLRQKQYDLAIVNAEIFPLLPGWIESRLLSIPYIYDFDDAFFLKYRSSRFRYVSPLLRSKFTLVMSKAAAITAGNQYLFDHARRLNAHTFCLPTVVPTDRYRHAPVRRDNIFTVGWIGSPSTSIYLSELVEPLAELARDAPIRFVVIGGRCPEIPGVEVVHTRWSEDTEVSLINTFDVGVMPLFDDDWSRGKCALKLIQYMACGVPVVASPVGANLDVVDSTCGRFASDSKAWRDALREFRDDLALRKATGQAGRRRVEERYSLSAALPTLVDVIMGVRAPQCSQSHENSTGVNLYSARSLREYISSETSRDA
jgi:glycosyltransferase involved in cell wall biosynthesis